MSRELASALSRAAAALKPMLLVGRYSVAGSGLSDAEDEKSWLERSVLLVSMWIDGVVAVEW